MNTPTTDVIPRRFVYDAECSALLAAIDKAIQALEEEPSFAVAGVARAVHDALHLLTERLVDNELQLERGALRPAPHAEESAA